MKINLFLSAIFIIITLSSLTFAEEVEIGFDGTLDTTGVDIFFPEELGNITNQYINNTNHSNSTNYWITDEGALGTVNSTQFENNGGTLSIIGSWISSIWCKLTGCTMTGNLTVNADVESDSFTLNETTIYTWDEVDTNISINYGANESDYPNDIIPWRVSNEGVLQVEIDSAYVEYLDNVVLVNKPSDLPTPIDTGDGLGTAYRLEAKAYMFGNDMTLDYPIVATTENDKITFITSESEATLNFSQASGGVFVSNSNTTISRLNILNMDIITQPGASLFNIDGAEYIQFKRSIFRGVGSIGSINNTVTVTSRDSSFIGFNNGLAIENCTILYMRAIELNPGQSVTNGFLVGVEGTFLSTVFTDIQAIPISGDAVFNFDSDLSGRIILHIVNAISLYGGIPFKAGSLDQTDPKIDAEASPNIPNSHTIGSLYMERNSVDTIITIAGNEGDITSFINATLNRTNITSAAHGLNNGDIVWIINDYYAGKYEIGEVSTNNFLINISYSENATGMWETGWVLAAGKTLASENERANMTGNNTLTFYNLEEQKGIATFTYNPQIPIAATKDIEFCIMKNDARIKGTLRSRSVTSTLGEGLSKATTSFISGDVFGGYVRNVQDTTDIEFVNMYLVVED